MLPARNPIHLAIKPQKDILRQFLRLFPVAKEPEGKAEDERLILLDDLPEIDPHTGYYG